MYLYHIRTLLAAAVLTFLFTACEKGKENNSADTLSTFIKDLPGDTLASLGDPPAGSGKQKRPFHLFTFRFSNRQQQFVKNAADSAQYLPNDNWDIAFTKEYNSLVVVNNGARAGTPGYGGPGTGSLLSVEKPYDLVTEAPDETVFIAEGRAGAGWDPGNGSGWYFYSQQNHIAVPIKNRTFIVKTATGKYAKLELLNIYKGNPSVVTDLFWPAPYLTFRYFVQTDGSRNLRTQ